jgi:hypothetical protein
LAALSWEASKASPKHQDELIAMASASPYTSVVIAAEKWGDDAKMMDNRCEKNPAER